MENDRELVERCLAGEVEAFHGLVERHRDRVYRVVYRFLGNHHDALEVTQETFTRAYVKLGSYDPERPFGVWLLAIGSNLSRDLLRKRGRRGPLLDLDFVSAVAGGESPERCAERAEEAERLRRAVATLSAEKRIPVVLRYYEGMSLREIAEVTGVEVSTLKVRLFRARKELLGKLTAGGPGDRGDDRPLP